MSEVPDPTLLEKTPLLGGNALKFETCFKGEAVGPMMASLTQKIQSSPHIRVHHQAILDPVVQGSISICADCLVLASGLGCP